MELEKAKAESDSKRYLNLMAEFNSEKENYQRQLEKQQQQQHKFQSAASFDKAMLDHDTQHSPNRTLIHVNRSDSFDYSSSSLPGNGAINVLESLQSKLKQKDGEIIQLQVLFKLLLQTKSVFRM